MPFRNLAELVERDMLSREVAEFLRACVRANLSIVFAGAPGSGKTTLLSCCAAELDPSLRVVIAEEVFEADVPVANVASMQTRAARSDRPAIDLRRLVAGFLRMAPDVAIVGEVRDREALPRHPYPPLTSRNGHSDRSSHPGPGPYDGVGQPDSGHFRRSLVGDSPALHRFRQSDGISRHN